MLCTVLVIYAQTEIVRVTADNYIVGESVLEMDVGRVHSWIGLNWHWRI